jgi:cyclase
VRVEILYSVSHFTEAGLKTQSLSAARLGKNTQPAPSSRRDFLRLVGIGGTALLASGLSSKLMAFSPQQTTISPDMVAQMRAAGATAVLKTEKLRDQVYVITGSGGNVAVLDGPDGKIMVDSGFGTSEKQFRAALADIGSEPLKLLVNTHWHFDHTDNNAWLHKSGATLLGHENTRKHLTETHHLDVLNVTVTPTPADGLPQQTFRDNFHLYFNNEQVTMGYFGPAHTDGDIWVRFEKANVLHVADIFFNGLYPFIDKSTGGSINGMIAAANKAMTMADAQTKIVSGHGPIGDKAALAKYISVLSTCRDKVKALKTQGKTLKEAIAAKPTAQFDDPWGKVLITPEGFITLIYTTL